MKYQLHSVSLAISVECAPDPQVPGLIGALANFLPSLPLMGSLEALAIHREKAKRAISTNGPLLVKAKDEVSILHWQNGVPFANLNVSRHLEKEAPWIPRVRVGIVKID